MSLNRFSRRDVGIIEISIAEITSNINMLLIILNLLECLRQNVDKENVNYNN